MRKSTKKKMMGIFISFAFLASIITGAISFVLPSDNQQEVWAARLEIVVFNELQEIPAEIGVANETREKLFTLNNDNIIYKVVDEDVSLKEFFEIWGETFNSTCIMDHCNTENNTLKMYVCSNCLEVYTDFVENKDYQFYRIKDRDIVRIDYR
ncbi:MAG: hypothetical protein ABIE55_01970 [Candidatus Aenigmatarchaeota archaeon]